MESKVLFLASVLLHTGLVWVPAPGEAANAFCGMVVTADLELDTDLICADTALVVGARFIRIDLNGHRLTGSGIGVGVDNRAGFDSVQLSGGDGGVIDGFNIGIHVIGAERNQISRIEVRNQKRLPDSSGGFGVVVESTSDSNITQIVAINNEQTGIVLDGLTDSFVFTNALFENQPGNGMTLANSSDNRIFGNRYSGSTHDEFSSGLEVVGSDDNQITENRFNRNSIGISVRSGAHNLIRRNAVSDNNLAGIVIEDGTVDTFVVFNRVTRNGFSPSSALPGVNDGIYATGGGAILKGNLTTINADLGIEAFGVTDGNRNRAARNGNPLQCVGVVCTRPPL